MDNLSSLAQAIFDKKGFNILVLDARDLSSLADFFVIAEGSSDRHLQALCHAVLDRLDQLGFQVLAVEGKKHGEWIAIDIGEVIIHLFAPGWRERYALEELWRECQLADVKIQINREWGVK